jgi:hypothetical protein
LNIVHEFRRKYLSVCAVLWCFGVMNLVVCPNRIKKEWDVAAVNVLTLAASTAAMNWALAPSRSYGSTFKYEFQNSLQKLPNHVFDKSYPLREFDMPKRVFSFFYKAAQLSLVGMVTGSAGAGLASVMPSARNKEYVTTRL